MLICTVVLTQFNISHENIGRGQWPSSFNNRPAAPDTGGGSAGRFFQRLQQNSTFMDYALKAEDLKKAGMWPGVLPVLEIFWFLTGQLPDSM